MKRMKKNIVILAVVIVILAVASGLYITTRPTTRQITIQAYDFFFVEPGVTGNNPTITVNSGDTIVLTIQNLGSKDHELFVLTQSDYNSYVKAKEMGQAAEEPEPAFDEAEVEDVSPGQSKTGTFIVGQPGTYVYACLDDDGTEPLIHANKGMFGTFQVQQGGMFGLSTNITQGLSNLPTIYAFQAYLLVAVVVAGTFAGKHVP